MDPKNINIASLMSKIEAAGNKAGMPTNSNSNPNSNPMGNMEFLSQILGNNKDIAKKAKNMSAQERNALLANLSQQSNSIGSNQSNIPEKKMSEMTEKEKQEYRADLKKRLRNKQSMLKHSRTPHAILENNLKTTVEKATEKLAEVNNLPDTNTTNSTQSTENTVNTLNTVDNKDDLDDNLDDFVN